ncbi:MAG: STAS domain-containing protein [Planctomycetes bacterium]|nr:STAS domain-containing protein [Planctomycetota bacterium]
MAEYKRFEVTNQDDVTVLRLVDAELSDLVLQDAVYDELIALIEADNPQKLLIDFSAVQYCTTGIINSLLTTKKRVVANGGAFKMCGLTKHVHDAFKALNLENTVFEVYATPVEALAAFAG